MFCMADCSGTSYPVTGLRHCWICLGKSRTPKFRPRQLGFNSRTFPLGKNNPWRFDHSACFAVRRVSCLNHMKHTYPVCRNGPCICQAGERICWFSHWDLWGRTSSCPSYSRQGWDTITIRAFSRRFYPTRLTSVNTPIDTPTAESTMQGDSQLVRSS